MNKNIRKQIANLIKEEKNDWLEWYQGIIADRLDENLKTDKDKIEYLEELEGDGDYENLMYSQGYVQGLKASLSLLNKNK